MTLPLIYVMNHSPGEIRKELMYIMKNEFDVSARIKRAIQLVIEYGGIQFATLKMEAIAHEALELLESFPDNEAKNSLIGLVHYTMNREK
jgi:octaprenyl-diphosphate synthase